MMKRYGIILLLMSILVMAGCRSQRHAVRETHTPVNALQANMDMTLKSGNKSINLTGTFRAKRDDVVQLNLVYTVLILPVHVGTLEITPTDILVVDRMNKRYCRVPYSDVAQFQKYGIDFKYLQNLFWGDGKEIDGANVRCTYDSWTNLSEGRFPAGMTFTVRSRSKSATLMMQLSDIQETDDWNARTSVGSKYTPVSLDMVMNAIMKVAG